MSIKQSFLLVLLIIPGMILAQTGSITGTVTTSDGKVAQYVNIGLSGTTRGTSSDKDGNYTINRIQPGTYTLVASFVGLEKQEKQVEVKANEVSTINFVLNENAEQLNEVVISSEVNRYVYSNPSRTLRMATPIIEAPQNIQVIPSEILRDQQVISMSDGVTRNVSGAVRIEHWGDLYANINARGSQLQAFRNGFNVVNSNWGPLTEDMSFVDRIEFVKGPAGFMLANGDPSGLYNVVNKKPTGRNGGEINLTLGSFDLYRTALDLDGKLSKNGKLLYRLNLSAQQKKSHRANEFNDRYVIAPVISYQFDQKTKLTLEYTYQHAHMSDVGSFYVFSPFGYEVLPREFTSLPAGMPATNIHDHSMFANLQHDLNKRWKLTGQLARFEYRQEGSSLWPSAVDSTGKIVRAVSSWESASAMTMGQVFLNGEEVTGPVRHRILAGLDVSNKEYFADWGQYHVLDDPAMPFDPADPDLGTPANGYPQFDYSSPLIGRAQAIGGLQDQRYTALYLQDELGFFDNLVRLTLAGRFTHVVQSEYGGTPKEAEQFTPRAGISVSLTKNTSVYGLYDQAFIPQAGRLANGGSVEPITGSNIEGGIKKDWFEGRWNTSLSVYRIIKQNELTADPNSPPAAGLSIEMGEKTAQGVEFDLRGKITDGLNLVANYAYTDSRITKVAEGLTTISEGDIVPGFATHTINGWVSYSFQSGILRGFGANLGGTGLLDRNTYWDKDPNTLELPDYFRVDGGLFWESDKFKVTANVFNITDDYLYHGSWYNWLNAYYWQSEPGRNYRLSLSYRF